MISIFLSIFNTLLLIGAIVMLARMARDSVRANHILSELEGLRNRLLDASPNDIWQAKQFYKAVTTKDDLINSYHGLMEAAVANIRLANEALIYFPASIREEIVELVSRVSECAADANQCMNYSQLEANGEVRVDDLRKAIAKLRLSLQQAIESVLFFEADRRAKMFVSSKAGGPSEMPEPVNLPAGQSVPSSDSN